MLSHQNAAIIDTISAIPRQTILDCETPLIQLHALSSHLDIDLWMKRDDVAGPSFGGNKARQLEYYFGAACDKQADTIEKLDTVLQCLKYRHNLYHLRFDSKPYHPE